jgi:hypothetical protein
MVVSGNSYTGPAMTGSSQTTSGPATRVHLSMMNAGA